MSYTGPERRKKPRVGAFACPKCGSTANLVVNSRPMVDRDGVRRRRECQCGHRFWTGELPEDVLADHHILR